MTLEEEEGKKIISFTSPRSAWTLDQPIKRNKRKKDGKITENILFFRHFGGPRKIDVHLN